MNGHTKSNIYMLECAVRGKNGNLRLREGQRIVLSHREFGWEPQYSASRACNGPGKTLAGKGTNRGQDRGPPTFSILASETSIKMLNFLTAARPFSSAMIHLSMFFPKGQDTQSIILVRG